MINYIFVTKSVTELHTYRHGALHATYEDRLP